MPQSSTSGFKSAYEKDTRGAIRHGRLSCCSFIGTDRALGSKIGGDRAWRSGSSPCATPTSSMRTSKGSSPWSWRSSTGSARPRRPEGAQRARRGPATISSGCLGANPGPRSGGATASGRTRACRRGEGSQARCVGDQGNQRQFDEKGIYYFHQKGGTL